MKTQKLYITFHTSSEAMATERACKDNNVGGKLVPVPRVMSAACGMAWECEVDLQETIFTLLKEEDIDWDEYRII